MGTEQKFLLIGNSRLHWAIKTKNGYEFTHSNKEQLLTKIINTDNLIWATVSHYQKSGLKKTNQIKTKDIILKNIPLNFGVDRALNCLSANEFIDNPYKKNILIADFGTILSITKMNAEGKIIGGQLIPGFITQLKAMATFAKELNLPNKKSKIPEDEFYLDTESAMLRGVFNSLMGALNNIFKPDEDLLVFCGGDAELFSSKFLINAEDLIIKPNLTMEGMILFTKKWKILSDL